MDKRINQIASVTFFLCYLGVFSQSSKIEYYTFTKNTIDTTGIRSYLIFDEKKSIFIWKSISQKKQTSKNVTDEGAIKVRKIFNDTIGTRVLNEYNSDTLIINEPLLDENYTVVDHKTKKNWELYNDFKVIAGFKCQKAITTFRGRTFIAWFTPKIPVSTGPWKLNGLPGIILEAYDEEKKVNFLFKSYTATIKKGKESEIVISEKPPIGIEKFVSIKDNLHEKLIKKTLSKLPRGTRVVNFKEIPRKGIELAYEWEQN